MWPGHRNMWHTRWVPETFEEFIKLLIKSKVSARSLPTRKPFISLQSRSSLKDTGIMGRITVGVIIWWKSSKNVIFTPPPPPPPPPPGIISTPKMGGGGTPIFDFFLHQWAKFFAARLIAPYFAMAVCPQKHVWSKVFLNISRARGAITALFCLPCPMWFSHMWVKMSCEILDRKSVV